MLFGHDGVRDDPLVINPARANPLDAVHFLYAGAKNKVLAAKITGSSPPPRYICATIVVAVGCHVVWPTQMQKEPHKMIKEVLGVPLRGEIERATAFYGTVFGQRALGLQNFTAGGPEEKQIALVFRTFPSDTSNSAPAGMSHLSCVLDMRLMQHAVPSLRGMGATPSRLQQRKGPAKTRSDAIPSRSLLDMRDKTSWTTSDDSELNMFVIFNCAASLLLSQLQSGMLASTLRATAIPARSIVTRC